MAKHSKVTRETIERFLGSHRGMSIADVVRLHPEYGCFQRVRGIAVGMGFDIKAWVRLRHARAVEALRKSPDKPLRQIGEEVGYSYPTLSALAAKEGLLRHAPRNAADSAARAKEVLDRIIAMGQRYRDIALDMGIGRTTVTAVAQANGIRKTGWEGPPGRRCGRPGIPQEKRDAIVGDLRGARFTYREIAARNGVSRNTVSNVARAHGLSRGLTAM